MQRIQILIVALLGFLVFAPEINAQDSSTQNTQNSTTAPKETNANQLANWRGILLSIEQALARSGLEEDDLIKKSGDAADIRLKALGMTTELAPQLDQLRAQLDELGPGPEDGEPAESAEIIQKRNQLEQIYSGVDGDIKAAGLISIRAAQIEQQIITNRRTRFVTQISKHSNSFFDIKLWVAFWQSLDGTSSRFKLFISESVTATYAGITKSTYQGTLLMSLAVLVLLALVFIRRKFQRRILKIKTQNSQLDNDSELEHYINVRIAGLTFTRNGVLSASALFLTYFLLTKIATVATRLEEFLLELTFISSAIIMGLSLTSAFIRPDNARRRLLTLTDMSVEKIIKIVWIALPLLGLIKLLIKTAVLLVSPLEVTIVLSGFFALTCIAAMVGILISIATNNGEDSSSVPIQRNFIRWGYLNPLFWVAGITGLIALIAGYVAFAEFLAWQFLIAAMVFALLWLIIELLDLHRQRYLNVESGRWRNLSKATGFSRQTVLQGSVFGFGLAKLAAIMATLVVFMLSWGYRTGDWAGPVSEAFFGFKVGGLSISLSSIVLAIGFFITGYVITRAIQHWMRHQFLPTTSLDPGLRNSIATVMGYGGIVLSAILAITAAGLDLSKVAIVAGALSVGIGFGLQSIVNNFVSGLILLAERPIKSGDWIVTSGGEGTVRKTSVRSTEIETFDGATVIIPNSTLITDAVTNWTHHSQRGRIKVPVGVGYDSDPDQVRKILLKCANAHERIVDKPAAVVFFQEFGADALIFELRAYLADVNNSVSTKSDLRFSILAALRKAQIEIPYPQRDIHIKSAPIASASLTPPTRKPARKRSIKKQA